MTYEIDGHSMRARLGGQLRQARTTLGDFVIAFALPRSLRR